MYMYVECVFEVTKFVLVNFLDLHILNFNIRLSVYYRYLVPTYNYIHTFDAVTEFNGIIIIKLVDLYKICVFVYRYYYYYLHINVFTLLLLF